MYKVKLDEEKRGRSDKTAKRRESPAMQQGVRTNQTAAKVLNTKQFLVTSELSFLSFRNA